RRYRLSGRGTAEETTECLAAKWSIGGKADAAPIISCCDFHLDVLAGRCRIDHRRSDCQTCELRRLAVGRIGCDRKLDRYAESCERRRVIQSLAAHIVPQPDRIHFPNARLAVLRHDENSPVGTTRTVSRKK